MCLLSRRLVTWPWTLHSSLPLSSTCPDLRHILCSLPWRWRWWWVMASLQVVTTGPVSQLTPGHRNINPGQWDNSTWHKQTLRHPAPGPPTTTHNGPLASWSVLSSWFLNFQWLDENTNLHWMDGHLVNIYSQFSKLDNKSRICRVGTRCSFYFSEFSGWPAFSDVERASIFGKFIGIKLDVNRLSLCSTCLKHKLSLDTEKAGNGGQIFNATRVIDIRIRSVKQQHL